MYFKTVEDKMAGLITTDSRECATLQFTGIFFTIISTPITKTTGKGKGKGSGTFQGSADTPGCKELASY